MTVLDATRRDQKIPRTALAGRPRKIFRDPLAPYVGCKCGQCARCLDNANWNRLFQKFVDPTYYTRRLGLSMRSPLSDI